MRNASIDLHALVREHGGYVSRDGRTAFLPGPDHSQRDRGVKVKLADDGRPIVHSFHGDDWREVKSRLGLDEFHGERVPSVELRRRREALKEAEGQRLSEIRRFCREVWQQTVPAVGSPAEIYLTSRAIVQPPPAILRFHHACPRSYPDNSKPMAHAPAMVALVLGPDGKASGLHATYLKPDGSGKAFDDHRARRMFGSIVGGAVRLTPLEGGVLAVCEGIETALSFSQLEKAPCWAVLSASMMKHFHPPEGVKRLIIGADGDEAGRDAAQRLALQAKARREVIVRTAPQGRDWNDILREPS